MEADIILENHGSIWLFRPSTESARQWLEENTQSDAQWFGGALVVEPRYVDPLVEGLQENGFTVAGS
jgi:hypothetical protein